MPPAPKQPSKLNLAAQVGSVTLPNPVMTASGTAGLSTELGAYLDLGALGAVVTKSLAAFAWPGNPPVRVTQTSAGMVNSVGLQGPGVEAWLHNDLPALIATGARVVASIWGRSVEEYEQAAALLAQAPASVVAVEVNLSCPNLGGHGIFAQDAMATGAVMSATQAAGRPLWAKLTPMVTNIVEIAEAAIAGGAEALTLTNTVPALVLDPATRRSHLGGGMGGLSGPAMHPIALRAVYEVHAAMPTVPIVGVGGIAHGEDAINMFLAGANAVQIGTASFANPRATAMVLEQIRQWCVANDIKDLSELHGGAHRND